MIGLLSFAAFGQQLAKMRTLFTAKDKVQVYAIRVDNAEKNKGVIEKIAKDGKGSLPFPILSDVGHQTIDQFGLFDPAYVGMGIKGFLLAQLF